MNEGDVKQNLDRLWWVLSEMREEKSSTGDDDG